MPRSTCDGSRLSITAERSGEQGGRDSERGRAVVSRNDASTAGRVAAEARSELQATSARGLSAVGVFTRALGTTPAKERTSQSLWMRGASM